MTKIFILEAKGEALATLKHDELGYMDFIRACEGIEKELNTKDLYIIKGKLIEEFGFEETVISGGYQVTKKRGTF